MANVIVPLVYAILAIGKTIDLKEYASLADYRITSIFSTDDVEEIQVNDLNSTYYVLPDETIPYSKIGLPIDLVLTQKPGSVKLTDFSYAALYSTFDAAAVLTVTEYRKIEQSIKENATPISGWQTNNVVVKRHTHYFDKLHFGGRCIDLITIRSNVPGDVQIFRRILRDVMGTSGSIGKDTADLWRRAYKAMKESDDVRGDVYVAHSPMCVNIGRQLSGISVETFLEKLVEFPKYVELRDLHGPLHQDPIYVTLKPLHDLDKRFPSVEKNVEAERYLTRQHAMYTDLEHTYGSLRLLFNRISSDEDYAKLDALYRKLKSVKRAIGSLTYGDISIYQSINTTEFNNAFEKYYRGLDNSTENYFTVYKRLYDEIGAYCEDKFLKPVKGSLLVEKNEVVVKDHTEFLGCQQECLKDKKCRAVGYGEQKQCLIYYRSTNSAKILFPQSSSVDIKVYDRKCSL